MSSDKLLPFYRLQDKSVIDFMLKNQCCLTDLQSAYSKLIQINVPITIFNLWDEYSHIRLHKNCFETLDELQYKYTNLLQKYDALECFWTCDICNLSYRNVMALPCRHVFCCNNCVHTVNKCLLCNKFIQGVMEIDYG